MDCSAQPGTVARIRDNGETYCGCLNDQVWDPNQNRCAGQTQQQQQPVDPATQVAQANCSVYPNTLAQWNASLNRVECVCMAGFQPNGSAGCVATPETQMARADCSMYPGTSARWDAAANTVQCYCTGTAVWNGSSCVQQQVNCSMYPGTVAQGTQCVCPAASQWNGFSCIVSQIQQVDCSMYPGTFAQGTQCVCSNGTQWNGSQCVLSTNTGQQPFDYNGLTSFGRGEPQQQTGGTSTTPSCPFGQQWNGSACVDWQGGDDVNCSLVPNSTKIFDSSIGGNRCICNSGFTWGANGCTPLATTSSLPSLPQANCPPGQVNSGGMCVLQSSNGPSSGGNNCPPGSINLLGVCSAT